MSSSSTYSSTLLAYSYISKGCIEPLSSCPSLRSSQMGLGSDLSLNIGSYWDLFWWHVMFLDCWAACSAVNAVNTFLEISEYFNFSSYLAEIFCDQWWVFAFLTFHTWLNDTLNTSVLLLDLVEFWCLSVIVSTLILWLITRIWSFHNPHHFIEKHNIITLYLCFSILLLLDGFSIWFMERMKLSVPVMVGGLNIMRYTLMELSL